MMHVRYASCSCSSCPQQVVQVCRSDERGRSFGEELLHFVAPPKLVQYVNLLCMSYFPPQPETPHSL